MTIPRTHDMPKPAAFSRGDIIGTSSMIQRVFELVQMVAPVDSTVLLSGETGTGKELIARAVHCASPRRQHSLISINCAAIPPALLESQLFGHERGAFTGALKQCIGRFQAAEHGTLFLDEIGELPLELQPKLLRALQERQIERLGGARSYDIDVRIIAATNQDLEQLVKERKFRPDLYYRLNVFPIALPPLRERREDIPLLVAHFVQQFSNRYGKSIDRIPDTAMAFMTAHDWPGNIRELQNFIERSVVMTSDSTLEAAVDQIGSRSEMLSSPGHKLVDAERAHITAVLRGTNGVVVRAAAELGIPRTTLIAKMQRLGLSRMFAQHRKHLHEPTPLEGSHFEPRFAAGGE